MVLAVMLATDEDALICDFAEYYHIYDMQGLSPQYAAILASGLRDDSRIMLAMSNQKVQVKTQLVAMIADAVRWLCWSKTKDGSRNRNRPESILDRLLQGPKVKEVQSFRTAEEFERARARIIEELKNGN